MKHLLLSLVLTTLAGPAFADTQSVWDHHITAWVDRDPDAIAADYTDDSILIINGATFTGKTEIRAAFVRLFEIFADGDNVLDPVVLTGRIVYITWHYTPPGHGAFDGTDTFLIEDGKISVQTIASPLYQTFPVQQP